MPTRQCKPTSCLFASAIENPSLSSPKPHLRFITTILFISKIKKRSRCFRRVACRLSSCIAKKQTNEKADKHSGEERQTICRLRQLRSPFHTKNKQTRQTHRRRSASNTQRKTLLFRWIQQKAIPQIAISSFLFTSFCVFHRERKPFLSRAQALFIVSVSIFHHDDNS